MTVCPATTRRRSGSGRRFRAPARRGAFTLIEMLVALAVMVLAMAMVTTVFSVTAKTTATSAAVSEAETLARNFAIQLEEDLRYCDPSKSVLVLVGRTQAAALTEDLRQAGQHYRVMVGDPGAVDRSRDPRFELTPPPEYSDPRADILMFFTQRPSVSQSPPINPAGDPFGKALQRGAKLAPIQVVYGHAALDRAVRSGGTWTFADDLTHIETDPTTNLSPLPLTRWHLARRAVIVQEPPAGLERSPTLGFVPDHAFDRIIRCYGDDTHAGDSARLLFNDYLELFGPSPSRWWHNRSIRAALYSPYQFPGLHGYPGGFGPPLPWRYGAPWIRRVLYPEGQELHHHIATIIEQPPAALRDNLALDLVPGCAWFQVEFLLPEDPRNSNRSPLTDQRRDTPRWVGVTPGQTYVFVPDTEENRQLVRSQVGLAGQPDQPNPNSRLSTFAQLVPPIAPYNGRNSVYNRIVRMWPYAIRVTIRVIDHNGRLEQPIERSVVHWFP